MSAPKGWSWAVLGDLVEVNRETLSEACDPKREFYYLDLGCIEEGRISLPTSRITFREAPLRARRLFETGDVLMAAVRPQLGGHGYVGFHAKAYVCSTGFAVLHPRKGVLGRFVFQTLFSPWTRRQYGWLTAGSSYPALNPTQVAELEVLAPPGPEQEKIAEILDCWDAAIVKIEGRGRLAKERKVGLMQALLSGRRTFPELRGQRWRSVRVGALLEERDRYVEWSDDERYRFASIRRRSGGLFDRGTFFGREVKTKVLKLLKAGDFVISKRQVVHGAWAMVTKAFEGFGVSDEYDVLVNRDPTVLDMRFFNYLSQTRRLWHMAYLASNGVHIEKLIFDFDDFAKEKIKIPASLAEQARIADVLEACDRETELLEKQLAALKEQKRGLMQKLLTGEVRVKC
ncbi:MAG TPA: restriction endonuclease subunit S [Candidatus Paceibacterota bacterium]|nr:restriction endonuclease subunit S [Verrucomicrobiota bacterium]HRZ44559.1 restriction endonuclease subunit S [Candidatus Paceibacterota bacterium]